MGLQRASFPAISGQMSDKMFDNCPIRGPKCLIRSGVLNFAKAAVDRALDTLRVSGDWEFFSAVSRQHRPGPAGGKGPTGRLLPRKPRHKWARRRYAGSQWARAGAYPRMYQRRRSGTQPQRLPWAALPVGPSFPKAFPSRFDPAAGMSQEQAASHFQEHLKMPPPQFRDQYLQNLEAGPTTGVLPQLGGSVSRRFFGRRSMGLFFGVHKASSRLGR